MKKLEKFNGVDFELLTKKGQRDLLRRRQNKIIDNQNSIIEWIDKQPLFYNMKKDLVDKFNESNPLDNEIKCGKQDKSVDDEEIIQEGMEKQFGTIDDELRDILFEVWESAARKPKDGIIAVEKREKAIKQIKSLYADRKH